MKLLKIISIVLAVLGAVFLITGAVLGYKVLPDIIHDQIYEKTVLKNGTEQFERFEELPFPLDFKIHMFDIKNPNEIVQGKKPKLEERGPYIYKKYSIKEDITIDGDLITYLQRNTYNISDDGADDNEEIVMINVPLLGVFQQFESLNIGQLTTLLHLGFRKAFHINKIDNPHDFFIKTKVKDFTFGGYTFCRTPDITGTTLAHRAAKILCTLIKLVVTKTMDVSDDEIKFSLLGKKNGQTDGIWTINSGKEDIELLGEIFEFNKKNSTNFWKKDSHCNKIQGGDSVLYPPFTKKSTIFTIFSTDICRTVQLRFLKELEYKGVDAHRKSLTLDQLDSSLEINKCFCVLQSKDLYGQKECLPKGFMDMKPCLGAEIILSLPHFLWTDDSYSSTVIGLSPSVENHQTFIDIEPNTGSPLRGHKRMQFNMIFRFLNNMEANMKLVNNSVIPLMWVDEGVEISDDLLNQLKDEFVKMLPLIDILMYVLMGVGFTFLVGFGGYVCLR